VNLNRRILDKVISVVSHFLTALITLVVVFIVAQVFWRYVLGTPLMWTEQLCRFMFIWMMMLGIPCLFNKKEFMAFDLLTESFKGGAYHIVRMFIDAVICVFAIFWLYGDINLIMGTFQKWTTGVRIPYYCLYAAQGVSALLLFWVMFTQFIEQIIAWTKGKRHIEEVWEGEAA